MLEDIKEFLVVFVGIFLIAFIFINLIILPILYYESYQQARIYNEKHETEYTAWDFFWAKEQINSDTKTFDLE